MSVNPSLPSSKTTVARFIKEYAARFAASKPKTAEGKAILISEDERACCTTEPRTERIA